MKLNRLVSAATVGFVITAGGCVDETANTPPPASLGTLASGVRILEFGATWCGPCQQMKPILDQYEAETGSVIHRLDVDESPAIAQHFRVSSIPTIVVLQDGRVVDRLVGVQPLALLKSELPANAR
ncbi:MAG: thioredoxin family protein [Planctomycetota bacterium]